jgi:hypothetical protein
MSSKISSLIKPILNTPFNIDFNWWKDHDRDWQVYLRSFLCEEHRRIFQDLDNDEIIDWVDPKTAEVKQVDGLQHTLISHCAKQEGFISRNTALVDSVFKVFLSNGNKPLTPQELGEILNRPPDIILKTFSGFRVYKGIRPVSSS